MLTVPHGTKERIWMAIRTGRDPVTAGDPEFSLSSEDDETPGVFSPGRYVTTWSARNRRIELESPLIGAGQTLPLEAGVNYWVWFRFSTDDEMPLRPVGLLRSR